MVEGTDQEEEGHDYVKAQQSYVRSDNEKYRKQLNIHSWKFGQYRTGYFLNKSKQGFVTKIYFYVGHPLL